MIATKQAKEEKEAALGNGDARRTFQSFKLPKAPLTYHYATEESPPEVPELTVYVEGRAWERVDSFYGQAADAEVYIVREDADGNSWVQFGDGQTGSRLPSGLKNVSAQYFSGTGAYGAMKAGAKGQRQAAHRGGLGDRPSGGHLGGK